MTPRKPAKPWRAFITGPDVQAESAFTSEAKAYAFVHAALTGDSPAGQARIEQWVDGRWIHYATVTSEEYR